MCTFDANRRQANLCSVMGKNANHTPMQDDLPATTRLGPVPFVVVIRLLLGLA